MNQAWSQSLFVLFIASLTAAYALFGCSNVQRDKYFACSGTSGAGNDERAFFPESPTLHVLGRRVTIDGSQIFSSAYEVCDENDTTVFFTSHQASCGIGPADLTGIVRNGSFNKVSGRLELIGAGKLHGEYQCKEAPKKL